MQKLLVLLIILTIISSLTLSQTRIGGRIGGKANAGRAIGGGGTNGFTAVKTITIDPTKVSGGSDLSNFPMLFSGTFTYLKTTGNGGDVTDAQGDDIVFTSDSGCTTNLKFEQETYDATTGDVKYWTKIPTASTSVNTLIYLCYGKASITTFQGDATNVWTDYDGVWHLANGSSLSAINSVTNTNGAITGATATTGQIDGGGLFGAVSTDKIVTDAVANNNTKTISIWSLRTGVGGGSAGRMAAKGTSTATEYISYVDGSGSYDYSKFWTTGGASWQTPAPSTGVFHYFVITYDGSSTTNDPLMYMDGTSGSVTENSPPTGVLNNNSEAWVIGNRGTDNARNWAGSLDEFRIANVIRSADWILTEFNNQSSPATFYSIT